MAAFERATVGLFLWWSAGNAFAADPASVRSVSWLGVAETAERIDSDARARGMPVLARTDYAGLARSDGFRIPPTQTLLIDPATGHAPTRLVVWQADSGVTVVSVDERRSEPVFDPRPVAAQPSSRGARTRAGVETEATAR